MAITVDGLDRASKNLFDRAKRMGDLTPAMKVGGALILKETDDAFRGSRSPAGERWPQLQFDTLKARARKIKTRGKKGRFARSATLFGVGATILDNTSRMRNSANVKATRRAMQFSMVGYTGPHITGAPKNNLPKRNPTVFEFKGKVGSASAKNVIPRVREKLVATINRYIATGKP